MRKTRRLNSVAFGVHLFLHLAEKTCASDLKKILIEAFRAEVNPLDEEPSYTSFERYHSQQFQQFIADSFAKCHDGYDEYLERKEERRRRYTKLLEARGGKELPFLATDAEKIFFNAWNKVYKANVAPVNPDKVLRMTIVEVVEKIFNSSESELIVAIDKTSNIYTPKQWAKFVENVWSNYQQN